MMASFPSLVAAQNSPQLPISDSSWTATDDLGRTLPDYTQVGPPKANRWVGLFYWQWHTDDRWGPSYNVTEFMRSHPGFKDFSAHPPGGPDFPTWYWAEPLFGYYRSTDPWVIRKHLVMLADAGVDFLFLDYTNGSIYDNELGALLNVAEDLKKQGVAVPKLVFFLNSEPEWKIEALYKTWYKPGKYDDMWFKWQGKPLMMASKPVATTKMKEPALLGDIQDYFTWRATWAFQDPAKEPQKWRFIDNHPQRPAMGPEGKVEQLVVSKSLGGPLWDNMEKASVSATPGHVPVYNDQWVSPDAPKGLFFQEQWNVALKNSAPILLVTGWNEWTASVWETPGVVFLGRKTEKGQGHIVDEFNMDFNRDLEPMKGGYGDNYYWQFVANMRRYKGMARPEAVSAPKSIKLAGSESQWKGVAPSYIDTVHDIADRDWDGCTPHTHYSDTSSRNDIVAAKVARDKNSVTFHVSTAAPITHPDGKSWMLLLIDSDSNPATGWHGYDLLVNRTRSGKNCSVERYAGPGWVWRKVDDAPFAVSGSGLSVAISRKLLQTTSDEALKFDFKWADNIPEQPEIMDFYSKGDVAPDTRFNYRYEAHD